MLISLSIDPELRHLGIFLYYGIASNVVVEKGRVDVREHARRLVSDLVSAYVLGRVRELPIIKCYRNTMWRLGTDPTRVRLSSEVLLRRVLKSGSFPHTNNVVDSCSMASLETLIPMSVFDLRKIESKNLRVRRSRPGELFMKLNGDVEVLSGGEVVLSSGGNILHLYPFADSRVALVDAGTKDVLVVAHGVREVPKILAREAVSRTLRYLAAYCGAKATEGPHYVGLE